MCQYRMKVKSTKQRRASVVHREYVLGKVKDDYLDFYNFCDLLSEEQTSLYAAMGKDEDEIKTAQEEFNANNKEVEMT